jgi:hypothetical protein
MRAAVSALILGVLSATPVFAQVDRRIPVVAVDARAFFSRLNDDATTANNLDITVDELPGRALGVVGGVHFYPVRGRRIALGLGGELMVARGRRQEKDEDGMPVGQPVQRRLRSIAPQVSLNFGGRDGWSYLSGGIGPMVYMTFLGEQAPADDPPIKATINMGGGARWFFSSRLAFCFDVRWYLTRPANIVGEIPGRARARLLVLSVGIAIR